LELVLSVGEPPFPTTSTSRAVIVTISHSPRHLHEVSYRGSQQEDPSMQAATKLAMKKRLLGKRRFSPAIKIRVDTEVTEVIEVDNLIDTTLGDSFWNPIVMD
jgi:hypothetical protein